MTEFKNNGWEVSNPDFDELSMLIYSDIDGIFQCFFPVSRVTQNIILYDNTNTSDFSHVVCIFKIKKA